LSLLHLNEFSTHIIAYSPRQISKFQAETRLQPPQRWPHYCIEIPNTQLDQLEKNTWEGRQIKIVRDWFSTSILSLHITTYSLCLFASWWVAPLAFAETLQQSSKSFIQSDSISGQSKWKSQLSWSTSKNMDYYSDYFTRLNSNLNYGFSKDLSLGINLGYSQPINDNEEKVRRYGFQDISLIASFSNFANSSKLSSSLELTLPASRASQKASLIASAEMGISYLTRWKKLGIRTYHSFIFNHYQYDTADEFGYIPNSPYGLNNSVTGTLYMHPRFRLLLGGGLYFYQTYAGKNKQVNSLSSSAQFLVTRNWNILASYSWRDTLVTNNNFLDDDTTVASLSTGYSF